MTDLIACPKCDGVILGVEISGVHHGPLFWQCTDCSRVFHRFTSDHPVYDQAEAFIRDIKRHRASR